MNKYKCMCQGYWYNAVKVTEIICTNIYDILVKIQLRGIIHYVFMMTFH